MTGRLAQLAAAVVVLIALSMVVLSCAEADCTASGGHLERHYRVWHCTPNVNDTHDRSVP